MFEPNHSHWIDSLDHGLAGQVAFRRWESQYISDLTFVETSRHEIAYADHLHDTLEILWTRSGCAEMICHGRHYPVRCGDAVIIAPNTVHAGGAVPGSRFSFTTVHVPRALLEAALATGHCDGPGWPASPIQLIDGRAAQRLYRDLIHGLPQTRTLNDQIACLGDALARLARGGRAGAHSIVPAGTAHPAVDHVKSILSAKFAEPIDLSRLADEVHLHQRYLISLFKAATGIPPHQFQIGLRVDCARRLIDRRLPLSMAASTAGFSDQSHLNRHFKRAYGLTPGTFRRRTTLLHDRR